MLKLKKKKEKCLFVGNELTDRPSRWYNICISLTLWRGFYLNLSGRMADDFECTSSNCFLFTKSSHTRILQPIALIHISVCLLNIPMFDAHVLTYCRPESEALGIASYFIILRYSPIIILLTCCSKGFHLNALFVLTVDLLICL